MKFFIILFCFLIGMPQVVEAKNFGIVATVNEDAISRTDLDNRIKLILASSGIQNTKANRQKVESRALDELIVEQIKIQEAERQNIGVTQEEIQEGFGNLAAQNQLTPEQFAQVLQQQGIPKATLLNQVKSQLAWVKVVQRVLRPQIDVTETDIDAKFERIQGDIGQIEYEAFEIFLPVEFESQELEVRKQAKEIIQDIKFNGARFTEIAGRVSKAPSAANGGALGWVKEGQLSKEIDLVLRNLAEGQVSSPIRQPDGFYIISVRQKRSIDGEMLPSENDMLNAIGMERLNRLQERYLSDLRAAAFIDRRV
jgi:peptidyl-prolyl cis-trans isomerase SurA